MASEGHCEACAALRDRASAAVNRHVQATQRYKLSRLRHEAATADGLEIVVREAAGAREAAVALLKSHLESHRKSAQAAAD
jgi:hypothetical protein